MQHSHLLFFFFSSAEAIIFMDDFLGEHEITVEFTDSEGKTNNYKEKIIVE